MPKPRHNQLTWKNQYTDPDTRAAHETRRVNFKPHKQHRKDNNKEWAIRNHLQDEDVDMGGTGYTGPNLGGPSNGGGRGGHNKKYNWRQGQRSDSPAPNFLRRLPENVIHCFRVTLPFGNKYERGILMDILQRDTAPLEFLPIMWRTNGNIASFYVDDLKLADKLFQLNRRIVMPDGFKLKINVHPGTPNINMDTLLKEKIKLAMSKRYNVETKALDLTKFHRDPILLDTFCAIAKPIIFIAVIDIISTNIPELEALNLHDNSIGVLSFLKQLDEKLTHLKILHMSKNRIRDLNVLDALIGLPIVDLVLSENPVCDKFKDKENYVTEVRKRLPKVIRLDGIDLPPPILFDISENMTLPTGKQTFLCQQDGQQIVRQFLEQYYQIYDNENRQTLLQAYHENAIFSLTISYPIGLKDKNLAQLHNYLCDNRNLLRINDSDRRHKLLKQGHLAVVSQLQDMPKTKHDIHGFNVDLTIFTPQMLTLTISGTYKELKSGTNSKLPPLRAFYRTLIIIPAGTGFCIINDILHITNATDMQVKNAFRVPTIITTPSRSILPTIATTITTTTTPPVPVNSPATLPNDADKMRMIQELSLISGMNLEWSGKCLDETQWDYSRATIVFNELQKQGVIPPEAFVK